MLPILQENSRQVSIDNRQHQTKNFNLASSIRQNKKQAAEASSEDLHEIAVMQFLQNVNQNLSIADIIREPHILAKFLEKHNGLDHFETIMSMLRSDHSLATQPTVPAPAGESKFVPSENVYEKFQNPLIRQITSYAPTPCPKETKRKKLDQIKFNPQPVASTSHIADANKPMHLDVKIEKRFKCEDRIDAVDLSMNEQEAPISKRKVSNPRQVFRLNSDDSSAYSEVSNRISSPSSWQSVKPGRSLFEWKDESIYSRLEDRVVIEFDRILNESFALKTKSLDIINKESPLDYTYYHKKSKLRAFYANREMAESRSLNNFMSRKSRCRKKFKAFVRQNSLTFDKEENRQNDEEIAEYQKKIAELEEMLFATKNPFIDAVLADRRNKCGLI